MQEAKEAVPAAAAPEVDRTTVPVGRQRVPETNVVPSMPTTPQAASMVSEPRQPVQLPRSAGLELEPGQAMTPRGDKRQLEPPRPERGLTGTTGGEMQLARGSNWRARGSAGAKRWQPVTDMEIAAVIQFLDGEVVDTELFEIDEVREYAEAVAVVDEALREKNRLVEIGKLEELKSFAARLLGEMPVGVRLFDYTIGWTTWRSRD